MDKEEVYFITIKWADKSAQYVIIYQDFLREELYRKEVSTVTNHSIEQMRRIYPNILHIEDTTR